MGEVLDLSGAKTGQFDEIPPNWYDAVIWEVTPIEIGEDSNGKLPAGTPGYNIEFQVDGGEYDGRKVWNRFYLPDPTSGDYDEGKAQTMRGRFVDFLVSAGYAESDIKSGKFKFDAEDLKSRQLRISVGIKDGYNTVRNFKPVGSNVEEAGII